MSRVVHFEINADQPQRAVQFCQQVFDWKIEKWAGPADYWLVVTGTEAPGIDKAIQKRELWLARSCQPAGDDLHQVMIFTSRGSGRLS